MDRFGTDCHDGCAVAVALGGVVCFEAAKGTLAKIISNICVHGLERGTSRACFQSPCSHQEEARDQEEKAIIKIAPAAGGQPHKPLDYILQGTDISAELWDMEIMEHFEDLLAKSTKDAKDLIHKCPIFFFGRARQGKSTLINDLLQACGHPTRPAKEDDMKACTREVDVHKTQCDGWTTPGVAEVVVCFDTEGWEFGQQAVDLLDKCMIMAEQENIGKEVLQQRLVLVLVLEAENRHEIHDPKFQDLIKGVCDQAKAAADKGHGGRPVLLPVVSKEDLFATDRIRRETGEALLQMLKQKVGEQMEVQDPIFTGGYTKGGNPNRPCILNFKDTLSNICRRQLASEHILRAVTLMMEQAVMDELEEWDKQGIDPSHSLVRRFVWVAARHCNLRVQNLFSEEHCKLSWAEARKFAEEIRGFRACGETPGTDAWHSDPLRQKRQSERDTSSTSTGLEQTEGED